MNEQVVTFRKKTPEAPKERVLTIAEAKHIAFSELKVMNMILTNACNLSCSYCFEQHKKDYGKFNLETLKAGYDFLVNCNQLDNKRFQFFGGEPLAQKKMILEFIHTFNDILIANQDSTKVGIVTNGLLLTPEFIEDFCNRSYTQLCISLDTHNAEVDKRDIDQEGIDYILKMVGLIPQQMKDDHKFAIRCTINQESVYHLEAYIDKLYALGVRHLVIHPLIMSKEQGMIEWTDQTWNDHYEVLVRCINKYLDFQVEWAEGVGVKGQSNCMVGSDMITVDASGDFSGCYFFTNLKEDLGHTLLGNVFKDEIYIDRYQAFQKQYIEFHGKHEECKTCNYRDFCYQCPAGNASLGGELFRPDGMCKRIVKLFIVLRGDINKKEMIKKFRNVETSYHAEGLIVLARAAMHLLYLTIAGKHLLTGALNPFNTLPDYKKVLGIFKQVVISGEQDPNISLGDLLSRTNKSTEEIDAFDFYVFLCQQKQIPVDFDYTKNGSSTEECYFITLIHLLLLDGSQYAVKFEPEHSRSRLFEL